MPRQFAVLIALFVGGLGGILTHSALDSAGLPDLARNIIAGIVFALGLWIAPVLVGRADLAHVLVIAVGSLASLVSVVNDGVRGLIVVVIAAALGALAVWARRFVDPDREQTVRRLN
ncbi:hypothetical protein AB0F81_17680 [Actinoplanes sp. NPDC024001]|uniref:hypothetical protein n=1 Tax=Actinoplanes sp. NPDC024001 TaxID=3154598 RepID=UPI0033C36E26